jgi:UPF0271 protein
LVFRIYDASAFYAGVPFAATEQGHTTGLVFEEIKHIKKNHGAIDVLLQTGRLVLQDPDQKNLDIIIGSAKKTGDFQKMTEADLSAVALCYQLKGELVTDDFAVSNLAKNLKLKTLPIMTKGIKDVGRWNYYCPACKKEFSGVASCPLCGNKLNRRLLRTKP